MHSKTPTNEPPVSPAATAGSEADFTAERDRLLRALADAENSRRRAERRAAESGQYAVTEFARGVLDIADNLRRAIAASNQQAGDAALLEGVKATERMLDGLLGRFGIKRIAASGAPFDPTVHEAMLETDDPTHKPGSVAGVMEDGYTIHDRLLRPARVVVAKARSDTSASDGEQS
jgi:molecular chaperone GrpE